mgnify:FL=1
MDDLEDYQKRRSAAENRRRQRADRKPSGTGSRFKCCLLMVMLFGIITALVLGGGGYFVFQMVTDKYQKYAESFDLNEINNLEHPCIIYDRNGEEIGRIFDENRSYVPFDKISPHLINAVVAQEDKSFWTHSGFDPVGILRAAKETIAARGEANQGASTITQQLARNAYDLERRVQAMGGDKYERKIIEIFLAMRIEKTYDKRQIMEFYLNRVYFGRGYYGIRAAALGYFGKEPADLTVRESASIAALIKNPENYNPVHNPDLNFRWRNDVLDRMQRSGYLTAEDAERVKKQPLELNPKPLKRNTSFLHALVQQQAISIFQDPQRGAEIVKTAGIRIYTTIDKAMQEAAESSLTAQLQAIENRSDFDHVRFEERDDPRCQQHRYVDGAVYAVDNATGGVLVYVGGRSFARDNFDIIDAGRRPVGTAMLPFLYMSAIENGYSPCSRLVDDAMDNRLAGIGGAEGVLGEWGMEVSKGRYLDSVTLRQALQWSKIAASARLGVALTSDPKLCAKPFVNTLINCGITPPPRNPSSTEARPQYYPRVFLGTEPVSLREMVLAYTIFPNAGKRPVAPYVITKITDSSGNILWENPRSIKPVMTRSTQPCTAFRLHSIMRDALLKGASQRVQPFLPDDFRGAVKTGTNYDFADNALFGYTSSLTCAVWIGFLNDHQAIYPEAFSSDTCGPILGAVFKAADGRYKDEDIPMPDDTEEVEICTSSGQMATNFCFETKMRDGNPVLTRSVYREYFPKGDVSLGSCTVHGDGTPTLIDFLDASDVNNSRVLPVVPILPKGSALIGDDPYGCNLELNPRYRTEKDLASSGMPEQIRFGDDKPSGSSEPAVDTSIKLPPPRTMRTLPVLPLEL